MQRFLRSYPKSREVRASYARLLINNKELKEARAEYQLLARQISRPMPTSSSPSGCCRCRSNEFDTAETWLKRGLELKYRDPDSLRFYLGQACEEGKRYR